MTSVIETSVIETAVAETPAIEAAVIERAPPLAGSRVETAPPPAIGGETTEMDGAAGFYARQVDVTFSTANTALFHGIEVWRAVSRLYADAFDASRQAFGEFLLAWHAHLLPRETEDTRRPPAER